MDMFLESIRRDQKKLVFKNNCSDVIEPWWIEWIQSDVPNRDIAFAVSFLTKFRSANDFLISDLSQK
jgi:hypothetical protein